jgi:hypothetical protein
MGSRETILPPRPPAWLEFFAYAKSLSYRVGASTSRSLDALARGARRRLTPSSPAPEPERRSSILPTCELLAYLATEPLRCPAERSARAAAPTTVERK